MVARPNRPVEPPALDLDDLGKGAPCRPDADRLLRGLLGRPVSLEGLSRLFQPSFPGIRTFAIGVRATPDPSVELTMVGIARDGEPVWTGTRAFLRGPTAGLEIDVGFDEVDPRFRSRNILVDILGRQRALLRQLDGGAQCRLTTDAEGVSRFVCALHGFVFADETDEGPSPRSRRAMDPPGDRQRVIEAGRAIIARLAKHRGLGKLATEDALHQLDRITSPADVVGLRFLDEPDQADDLDDDGVELTALGRSILLDEAMPAWRGALYLNPGHPELNEPSETFRHHKTARSRQRLQAEIDLARHGLRGPNRAERVRSLQTLGTLGTADVAADIKALGEGKERRTAALARKMLDQINGVGLAERILMYADDDRHPPRRRALAYRVLAEHYPKLLLPRVPMLRVHPDARFQRAAVPLVALHTEEPGPQLAALLAANPIVGADAPRPGLEALRLDIIEWLTMMGDPRTLLPLCLAYQAKPPPPAAEVLALSRALVVFNDPRAKMVLRAGSFPLTRPDVP